MTAPLVVIGDALLDVDVDGEARRLAPDAPVPVIDDLIERARPGGAGMAALMAARDGHDVVLVCALGDDPAGQRLGGLLDGLQVVQLPYKGATPEKMRVRAAGQSLIRLDRGGGQGRDNLIGDLPEDVGHILARAGAVLVADYGYGVTANAQVRAALCELPMSTPVIWDPHPRGPEPVRGAKLVTPNESESKHFAELARIVVPDGCSPLAATSRRAGGLLRHWGVQALAVTLGSHGALLTYGDGAPVVTPAPAVTSVDTCGAGDRFAVTAALALRDGRVLTEAIQDAVASASEYVAAGGPAVLDGHRTSKHSVSSPSPGTSRNDRLDFALTHEGTVVATGGCFDLLHAGHVATLQSARQLGDYLVVLLNSDDSVRRLKGPSRPVVPAVDRARVLEALEFVDAVVVFDEDTPVDAIRAIRPDVWVKGGDYTGTEVPEAAVLKEWGGQAVVVPYLEGRSTTRMVARAARRFARHSSGDADITPLKERGLAR